MSNENLNDMPKDSKDQNYTDILLEDIRDKIDGLVEAVSVVNDNVVGIKQNVEEMKPNVGLIPVIRTAVTEQTTQHNKLEQRVTHLEAA